MAFPANFLDELRARLPPAAIIGRKVRLERAGRQSRGCCPFHNEKSPSFYVYDDGYHCFGCGAHGDIISFVMQTQGAGFMEAVEQLAGEAGLEVPKPTPQAAEAEKKRHDIASVLALAGQEYARRLHTQEGAAALAYLRNRALSDATIAKFGLGWAGAGRGALAAALAPEGITGEQLLEAGLLRAAEDGRAQSDLFYNRVMFPIHDRRGRPISFGGRTLGDGQPKYVNGPETELFSKRRQLYALHLAREGVRAGATAVAVEGYMDVIALHQAGFNGAVAPLGTALSAEQLGELWRLSPEPVLCFDGDEAGRRAARRAVEVALPLLAPDRSLKIATLPEKQDPDSLVRLRGNAAFQAVLDRARPLAQTLYDLLAEGTSGSPESRAALRHKLNEAASQIGDKSLAAEYRRALQDTFFARRPSRFRAKPAANPPFRPNLDNATRDATMERERVLTAILLRHPALLAETAHAYEGIVMSIQHDSLRTALLDANDASSRLDSAALMDHLASVGLDVAARRVLAEAPVPLPACARPEALSEAALAGWWHYFGLLDPHRLDAEIAAARRQMTEMCDGASQRRLVALVEARDKLLREPGEDEV
jgi:DNA primase